MRLELSGVVKSFGDRRVLTGVDLVVAGGEMLAVTGPSGSGKSTLLAIMSGLLAADAGHVRLVDPDAPSALPMRSHLAAWIPQGSNVLGARSVLDNAMVGALATGCDRSSGEELAERALSQMGIEERRFDNACVLSGGEQQRLAIARALCGGRPFLFADEPTGNLDRLNTRTVIAALRRAADDGIAVIVATHDPAITPSCDRAFVLDELAERAR